MGMAMEKMKIFVLLTSFSTIVVAQLLPTSGGLMDVIATLESTVSSDVPFTSSTMLPSIVSASINADLNSSSIASQMSTVNPVWSTSSAVLIANATSTMVQPSATVDASTSYIVVSQTVMSSAISPASRIPSFAPFASTVSPTGTSGPVIIYHCGAECVKLKKQLYAAGVFAILFLLVSVVLGLLLYRQVKITRESNNDPALSRLI